MSKAVKMSAALDSAPALSTGQKNANKQTHNGHNGMDTSKGHNEHNRMNGNDERNGYSKHNGHIKENELKCMKNGTSWEEQFLPPQLVLPDMSRARKVEEVLSPLVLCGEQLRRVAEVFTAEIERGLRQEPSSLQMENTYVPELPDGTEEGVFLALDLGGTNFRVLLIELRDGELVREDVKQYHISDELRLGPGQDLFEYLADCVQDFLRSEGMEKDEFSLGFTFSFPMKLHSISSGELITWTKSFKCGGMCGADVAALLQRCLHKRGLRVTVQVLLNDTTGTLVSGAQQNPEVGIGVILGTGSNGCYMERASRVSHWEAAHERVSDVCVDIEWGAFGDNGCLHFIRTNFDEQVDANSLLAKSFTFEKYIGGKYLGDLLQVSLQALADEGLLAAAPRQNSLLTQHVSLFEEENERGEYAETLATLQEACGEAGAALTVTDALIAQHTAAVITNRAAQLVSVCISNLLRRMDRPHVGVAIDGSVYKRHPRIKHLMEKYISLLSPDQEFTLFGAEDGSGKGSALTAAIAARIAARSPPCSP